MANSLILLPFGNPALLPRRSPEINGRLGFGWAERKQESRVINYLCRHEGFTWDRAIT